MAVRFAAAAQEQSWGSCKELGWVGRGGGRGAGRVGGDGGEDLLHQGPCSSDCHHLSLLALVQRTRHSSHGLTGGVGVGSGGQNGVGTSRKKKRRGHLGPQGSRLFPGLDLGSKREPRKKRSSQAGLKGKITPSLGVGSFHLHDTSPRAPQNLVRAMQTQK